MQKKKKSKVISMVGKNDGYAYKNSNITILMSSPEAKYVTPVSESLQAVIWHALVSHPILQKKKTKWWLIFIKLFFKLKIKFKI